MQALLRRFAFTLLVILVPLPGVAATAQDGPAKDAAEAVIKKLNAGLEQAMNVPGVDNFNERKVLVEPLMRETFNYPYMAAVAAGRHWAKLSEDERQRYVTAFEDLAVAQAASRFKSKPGTRFTIVGGREGPKGSRLVDTQLQVAGGKPRKISYLVQGGQDGRWQAVDVFYDGTISELATLRSEYSTVIGASGIDALIDKMKAKAQDYATKN